MTPAPTQPPMYALYSGWAVNAVVHRVAASVNAPDRDALCGYTPPLKGWYAIASAPRELPGTHRLCLRCERRAGKVSDV